MLMPEGKIIAADLDKASHFSGMGVIQELETVAPHNAGFAGKGVKSSGRRHGAL